MDRQLKQAVYGGAYVAIFALFVTGLYFLFAKPAISCTNKIKDGTEEGIDCGGSCQKICLPSDLQSLRAPSVQVFSPVVGKLGVLINLQNPNPTLAARSFAYQLDLLNASGTIIKSFFDTGYLYANEATYLAQFLDGYDTKTVSRAEIKITSTDWAKTAEFPKPQFDIQDRKVSSVGGEVQVSGRLVHRDTVNMPVVKIIAIFKSGGIPVRVLGVSATELDDVAVGDSRPFAIVYPAISGIDPSKTELVVSARRP